jgi:cytochrome c5
MLRTPRPLLLAGFGLWLAAAALAIGTPVRAETAAAAQRAERIERAERLLNASCQGCHDTRVIQTQARSAAEWEQTIATMVEKGATVAKEDVPLLVDYLVDHHGPMPDGRGKAIVLNTCTLCHDLSRIKLGRRSPEEWEETLISMLNEGAPLSEADFPVVHTYLARNFGIE